MSIRTFIFCDICNPTGVRVPEDRRNRARSSTQGRRLTDGRSWFEGSPQEATAAGWHIEESGRHVCDRCFARGLHAR